jgi:hypothetical protein
MKAFTLFVITVTFFSSLLSSIYSSVAFADVLECQPEDSNYSIAFNFETDKDMLKPNTLFSGDLFASVNDDPGDVSHSNVLFKNTSKYLKTVARGKDELTGAETLFATIIDISFDDEGLYYGLAYLKSNIETDLPNDYEVLADLEANLQNPNSSGWVSCEIKKDNK